MIADDTISKMLTYLAVVSALYLAIIDNMWEVASIPLMIILVADFLERKTFGKIDDVDHVVGSGPQVELTRKRILLYTVFCVMIIAFCGIAINKAFVSQQIGVLSILGATSFSILMAVAEERIFRKWATNFFVTNLGQPAFGALISAVFFTVYHFGRYHTDVSALLYVFAGGMALSFIAWQSGRLSPVILAHVCNNVAATADLSLFFTTETLTLVGVSILIYVFIKKWEERGK